MRTRALILEGPSAGLIWLKEKQSMGHLFLQLQNYYLLFDLLFLLYTLDMQARNPLDLFAPPEIPLLFAHYSTREATIQQGRARGFVGNGRSTDRRHLSAYHKKFRVGLRNGNAFGSIVSAGVPRPRNGSKDLRSYQ